MGASRAGEEKASSDILQPRFRESPGFKNNRRFRSVDELDRFIIKYQKQLFSNTCFFGPNWKEQLAYWGVGVPLPDGVNRNLGFLWGRA